MTYYDAMPHGSGLNLRPGQMKRSPEDETMTPQERSERRKTALKIAGAGAAVSGVGWGIGETARGHMERKKLPTSMFSLKTYGSARRNPKTYAGFLAGRALGTGLSAAGTAPMAYGAYNAVNPRRKIERFDSRRDLVDPTIGYATGRNQAAMISRLVDRNPPGVAKKPESVAKYVDLEPAEERELARRKRAARGLAYTTGTTGLTALALTAPQGAKMIRRSSKPFFRKLGQNRIARKLAAYEPRTTPTSQFLATAGAGIGGVGSFNFARMQGLEAKREQGGVVKSDDKGRNAAVGGGVGELKKGFDPLDGARAFKKPLRGPRGRVVQRVKARPDHGDDWSAAHRVDPRGPQRSAKALIAINPAKSEGAGWEEVMRHEMIHAGVRKPRSAIARQSANPYKDGGEEARAHALSGSWRNMGDMSDRPKEFRRGFDDVMGILESKGLRKSIDYQRVSPGAEDAHRNLSSGRRQQAMGSVISGLGAAAAGSVAADTYLNRGTMSRPGKVSGALAAATVPFATLSMIQNAQDARSLDKKVKRIERKAAERERAGVYGRDRGLFPYQERSGKIVEKALSPKELSRAKARARAAGRPYPNAFDNMVAGGMKVKKAGFTAKPGFTTIVQTKKGKLYRLSRQAPLGFKPAASFAVDSKGTVKETAERVGRLRDLDRPETSLTSTPYYPQQVPVSGKHSVRMVTRSNPVVKGLRPISIKPRRVTMRAGGLVSRNGQQFTRRGSLG